MKKPFRIVKHVHQALPNETVKRFFTYDDAATYLKTITDKKQAVDAKKHWLEGKINGEWYGLA